MAEQDRAASIMPLLLVFTVMGVGGGLYLHEPFESSRPREAKIDIPPAAGAEFVPARAWQDPFSAIARCRGKQTKDVENNCNSIGDYPTLPESISFEKSTSSGKSTSSQNTKLMIMPVMVYGGAYSEEVENRRRRRYAVLSAIAKQDYQLADVGNIGYFKFHHNQSCDASAAGNADSCFVVPYEWLRHNSAHNSQDSNHSRPPILLLWLDERQFGVEPLTKIANLLRTVECELDRDNPIVFSFEKKCPGVFCLERKCLLTSDDKDKDPSATAAGASKSSTKNNRHDNERKHPVTVTLIGPAGSAVLSTMVKEAHYLACNKKTDCADNMAVKYFKERDFSIFSPTATASARLILGQAENKVREHLKYGKEDECEVIKDCHNVYPGDIGRYYTYLFLIGQIFSEIHIDFFRTTISDNALARTLVKEEFKNRNIDLSDNEDSIVLISEWDTFYGRALPGVFKKAIEKEFSELPDDKFKSYYYMRGLDGEIVPDAGDANGGVAGSANERKNPEVSAHDLERSVGVKRFDYLRRLSRMIKDELSDEPGEVRAIGVLGSDVYDKLLVLQAMRPSFPNALFFTTDADARYVHPTQFKWTRNLIVLSGYGLTLDEEELSTKLALLKGGPMKGDSKGETEIQLSSFRDNYQTAIFLTTILAVSRLLQGYPGADKIFADNLLRRQLATHFSKPESFEVGRFQLVPLGAEFRGMSEWWDNFIDRPWAILPALFCVLFVCLLTVFFRMHSVRSTVRAILLAGFLPVIVTLLAYIVDGTSGEPLPLFSGTNSLPTIAVLILTIVGAVYFVRKTDKELKENICSLNNDFRLKQQTEQTPLSQIHLKTLLARGFTIKLARSLDEEHTGKKKHMDKIWKQYQQAAARVLPRALVLAVFHTVFAILLVVFIDGPRPPIRGSEALFLYNLSISLALLSFFWSLYVVIDHLRLGRVLVRLVAKSKLVWSPSTLNEFARKRGIKGTASAYSRAWMKDSLMSWLSVRLLAERTEEIDKCVYYPFIVLLGLIIAHSTMIDNWQFLPAAIAVIVTSILLIVAWVVLLRQPAKDARETALETMQTSLSKGLRPQDHDVETEQLRLLIDEVKTERRGVFDAFLNDRIFKALLMPSGGVGGLFLLEYLSR